METLQSRLKKHREKTRVRFYYVLFSLLGLVVFNMAVWEYLQRPETAFGEINIQGTDKIKVEDILNMSNSQKPVNLFRVSAKRVEDGLSQDIRFCNVKAEYEWPNKLNVSVNERKPALYVANAYNGYVMMDDNGVVMNVMNAIPNTKVPFLAGEKCGNVFIGDSIVNKSIDGVLGFMTNISSNARKEIASLAVDSNKDIRLQLCNGLVFRLGSVEHMPEKASIFNTVFNETKNRNIQVEYIDLRFKKPYLKLKPNLIAIKK